MKHRNVRQRLIENTVKVIAENGFDKTTTKSIVAGTDINEAYIYREFSDKEDLFIKVFDVLDGELVDKMLQSLPLLYTEGLGLEARCRLFFDELWKFFLGNKERCFAFVRYYYSPYFNKYSAESHKRRCQPFVEQCSVFFIEEANVWMILNHLLNVMMDFAIKVHNDQMPEEDDYSEHVFRVVYRSIEQYFKKEEVNGNG